MRSLGLGLGFNRHRILGDGVVPLLDTYTGASVAYSLRNLSSSTTNVVRVRRSSNDDEQDFTASEVSGGALTTFVGAGNDGFVTTWYDQSGNSNNATQTSASQQPKIVDSGSLILDNGKPIIQNLSAAGLQVDAALTNTSPVTQFSVAKIEGTRGIFSTYRTTGDRFVLAAESGSTNTSVFSDTPTSIFQDGSSYTVTNRGTLYNDSTSQSLFTIYWSSPNYQEFDKIGFTSGFWQMWSTQELIIYNSDQTSNRAAIEDNINSYYSIYT